MEVKDYERGVRLLNAAKKIQSAARLLDEGDAADLRKKSDDLIQRGLRVVLQSVREMAAALREMKQSEPPGQG